MIDPNNIPDFEPVRFAAELQTTYHPVSHVGVVAMGELQTTYQPAGHEVALLPVGPVLREAMLAMNVPQVEINRVCGPL
jgi:hypothetical protein